MYRKWSFGQGNVFTPVCQSFCSQGGMVKGGMWSNGLCDTPPWTQRPITLPQTQIQLGPSRQRQRQTPPVEMVTPTGMHSCFSDCLVYVSHHRSNLMIKFGTNIILPISKNVKTKIKMYTFHCKSHAHRLLFSAN